MSENRPSQTTINGMTLERAEQRFNEYRDSTKGSTELHDYICDTRTPALVSYTAMHFAFGAVGTLKFIPFQTAVKIAAHTWQPSEEQLSAFVAPGNFGRRAIKGNANAFAAELLRIPETYNRLVHFKLHIFGIWMPIAADIVEFMTAGATTAPLSDPAKGKPGRKAVREYQIAWEEILGGTDPATAYQNYLARAKQIDDFALRHNFNEAMRRRRIWHAARN